MKRKREKDCELDFFSEVCTLLYILNGSHGTFKYRSNNVIIHEL